MVALGCDRCVRRHSRANLACAGATGVFVRRAPAVLYATKTGVRVGRFSLRMQSDGRAMLIKL